MPSVCTAGCSRFGSSRYQDTDFTPVAGSAKTYSLPLRTAPSRGTGLVRVAEELTSCVYVAAACALPAVVTQLVPVRVAAKSAG